MTLPHSPAQSEARRLTHCLDHCPMQSEAMLLPTVMARTVQSEAEPSQSGVVVAETLNIRHLLGIQE